MEAEFVVYVALSLITSIILSLRTNRKLLTFIIVFFILAQPVLTSHYTIDLPGMPFDLRPNRILLFVMLSFLVWGSVKKYDLKNSYKEKPAFEIFLYTYLILVIISLIFNFNRIQTQNLIVIPAEILLFIFVYHVLKRQATPSVLEAFVKAIVILSLFAAIVAIYQVLVDSSFLKICSPRHAFGNVVRSSAFFRNEYELGYFLNLAIIVFLVRYRGRPSLFITLPLLIIALFTTFHRLSWIMFLVCLISYLFLLEIKIASIWLFVLIVLSCIISMSYFANPEKYTKLANRRDVQAFTKERLLSDNVTGRLYQFLITAEAMSKHFMGLGGYDNKEYYNLMARHGMMKNKSEPFVVHNGYLAIGIKYGFLAMIAFTGLIVSMLLFFKKHMSLDRPVTVYPFYVVLIWIIANLSNSISLFRVYFVLLVAIVCGSFVSLYREDNIQAP